MTKEQLYNNFLDRYNGIIRSGITGEMERLGDMTNRVMRWLCTYEPHIAESAISILDGDVECNNYLTEREAEIIVAAMRPKPDWDIPTLEKMLDTSGMLTEEPPYYNRWALITTMEMILSDSGNTLKGLIGSEIRPAKSEELLNFVYHLAVDKLKDEDGKFKIRKYFDV